ncbi:head GIN domain-containing protein [Maribacter aestuarii]|uniref:head GIN domain-containing protein n=1 Tax=Maribacter aestuarii TaxID=1130723 RepID=UPI00248BA4D4|nr:head GIN domain-containing protein [Maribacter aestuarii]
MVSHKIRIDFSFRGSMGVSSRAKRMALIILPILICISSCSTDAAPDCLQNAGDLVRQEIMLPNFDKITVFEKVALVLKQGDIQKVEIETGEFLREEVSVVVEGDRLVLRNENGCNFFREYGVTTIYVTSPNITQIRSSTGLAIKSDGVLDYPNLALFSESFNEPEAETTDGEFDMTLNATSVSVVVNGIAYFKLSGTTENLSLNVAAGDSRIEAENLIAQNINLNHRGSNDLLILPESAIRGTIRGYGNVISFNRPSVIEVEELFNGKLIFKD